MEDHCNSFYYHDEGVEECLKHSLLYTTLEELARKDEELIHLKIVLRNITKERNDAMAKCQRLMLEKLHTDSEDEPPSSSDGIRTSDSDDNVLSIMSTRSIIEEMMEEIEPKTPLPEKGKFLQAVMEAGPILQTLLVTGPLPQWQHPPPHLGSVEIPPVILSSPNPRFPPPPQQESAPHSAPFRMAAVSTRRGHNISNAL